MNLFIGDYKTFYKFVGGYARNKTLEITKPYKTGVCACCGVTGKEIQSAHKYGCERADLVKKWFHESVLQKENNDVYRVNLDEFDRLFIEFTSDISNFYFLCESCHKKYDRKEITDVDFEYIKESIKKISEKNKRCSVGSGGAQKNSVQTDADRNLQTMGKSWFVSFMYQFLHPEHKNWTKTIQSFRTAAFKKSKELGLHKRYIETILKANEASLGTNRINLTGVEVKKMAQEIFDNWEILVKNPKYAGI